MNADLDAQYNNRARVPDHPAIFERWSKAAAAYRATSRAELGVPYGQTVRHYYDVFPAVGDGRQRPLVVFIHGGYWRSLDPRMFSHMARGLNARGHDVALTGYDLCPQVSILDIIAQQRRALAALWRRFGRRMVVAGHSAGGHLAACMLATNWPDYDRDLPPAMVGAAYAISGLFDLSPLLAVSMNEDLRLDAAGALAASPQFWAPPAGLAMDAVVGGDESEAFLDQTRAIADAWRPAGVAMRAGAIPGTNHFTVLDPLEDASSLMTARIAQLARAL